MDYHNEKPLGFGEILDLTFHVIKEHFAKLFLIMLILTGPLYLLQALGMLLGGTPFFREVTGGPWYETFLGQLEGTPAQLPIETYGGLEFTLIVGAMFLLMIVALPIAEASVILSVDFIRRNENFTVGTAIKRAFSRYWALLGGSVVFFLILFGFLLVYIFAFSILFGIIAGVGGILNEALFTSTAGIVFIIILMVLLLIALLIPVIYLSVRWSFYLPPIVFEKVSPGLSKSWQLTRRNFWRLLGLFIVISIIIFILSVIFQFLFQLLLGSSVLATLLSNILSIFTTMISFVAYAIVYFDLLVRNDAADLKTMIASYSSENESPSEEKETEDYEK